MKPLRDPKRAGRARRLTCVVTLATILLPITFAAAADSPTDSVPYIKPKPEWDRFLILVWQYQTSAFKDTDLYKQAGFHGFHIDRGADAAAVVDWARTAGFPYYVDHAADKGYLHLTEGMGVNSVLHKKTVVARPNSLADPKTIETMKGFLRRNIAVTGRGPAVAYAFDDEVSLGSFTSPAEVDGSPLSVAGYRQWLARTYGTVDRLNAKWATAYKTFAEARPYSFEEVRSANSAPPLAKWNLSRWMDWRTYMDTQFADCLADLTRFANTLDPSTPAGFVGGQQPSPWGGYDYAKLSRAVQWTEAYDIGGTCEILRSLWKWPERRPYVQTWFSAGDAKADSWFLWYYMVHGCRGVIAWPDRDGSWFHWKGGGLAPFIADNAATIREVQGDASKFILDPATRFDADPIALYYSHPSVQASWAMDVVTHGGTWPNRSSSMDNSNQSAGRNRVAWMKLLEDCGYQYNVVTSEQAVAGVLEKEGYRVLILDRTIAMSDAEAAAIRRFVERGGTVIADCLTGVLDEHGAGRPGGGALDDLFGILRDESKGYLDGKGVTEIDGELYQKPFMQRLRYAGALRDGDKVVFERGTQAVGEGKQAKRIDGADVVISKATGKGRTVYLNLTPVSYNDLATRLKIIQHRLSSVKDSLLERGVLSTHAYDWGDLVNVEILAAGLKPRVQVHFAVGYVAHDAPPYPVPLAETLLWRKGDTVQLAVIMNAPREAKVDSADEMEARFAEMIKQPIDVTIVLDKPATAIRNVRTGERLPDGDKIAAKWSPWEALIFEFTSPAPPAAAP